MVELAIFLPILFLITMATLETCHVIYLRQSVKIASFEAARLGILPGATEDTMRAQCDCILLGRNINSYEFEVSPEDFASIPYGELITVRVVAPIAENSVLGSWIYRDRTIDESVRIMKE